MILWVILATVIVSAGLSFLATSLSKPVAYRLGALDVPSRHKTHAQATPMLGGSAMFAAMLGLSLLVLALARIWAAWGIPAWMPTELAVHVPGAAYRAPQALGILAAAAVLHIVGLIDDRKHLGAWPKLLVQTLVAAAVVLFCDVRVLTFAGAGVSITASILWLVLVTNSLNFLDNMDGLAAGVAAICSAALLAAAVGVGQWFVAGWACLLLGTLLGFLVHNFPPASVFMGDAGSLVVGFLLAVLSCLTTYVSPGKSNVLYGVFVPVLLLAVPLYDTFSVIWIRLREGRKLMIGDRKHFSHRLCRRGMTPRTAVLTIYLCTACTAIAASLLPHVTGAVPAILLAGQVLLILMVIAMLEAADGT